MMEMQSVSRTLRWVWLGVLVVALLSRVLGLGAAPLMPDEVERALGSMTAARRAVWPATTDSPLLLVGNALLFGLFSPSEYLARLIPALAGAGVVMLPFLWRRKLGEVGALAASGLLLVSPLTLFAARRVDGAAVATLAVGLLATAVLHSREPRATAGPSLPMVSAAVAIGLLSGPAFYDLILIGVLVWAVPRGPEVVRQVGTSWREALLVGVGAALLISVGLGFRWSGWAGIADGAAAWLAMWGAPRTPGIAALGLLALYEPVLLVLVVAAVVFWGVYKQEARRVRLPLSLLRWAAGAVLLNTLRPGSTPATLSAVMLPLALAGGWAVGVILTGIKQESRISVGFHSWASLIFWLPALASVAQVAARPHEFQPLLVFLGIAVLMVLQVLIGVFFALHLTMNYVWRGALLGSCAALMLIQLSFAGGLAYVRPHSPVEPAVVETASSDLRQLVGMLHELAVRRNTRWDALDVVVIDRDPRLSSLLRWHLREFENLRLAAEWPDDLASVVITPETAVSLNPADPAEWLGMAFVALTDYRRGMPRCQAEPLDCSDALRWYLYRASPTLPATENVVLWQSQNRASW
jgi:hypothetical protein